MSFWIVKSPENKDMTKRRHFIEIYMKNCYSRGTIKIFTVFSAFHTDGKISSQSNKISFIDQLFNHLLNYGLYDCMIQTVNYSCFSKLIKRTDYLTKYCQLSHSCDNKIHYWSSVC